MPDPDLILDARRGIARFAFVALVALAVLVAMGLLAADMVFGLNPNVPDREVSLAGRVAISLSLAGCTGALITAILLYGARYIVTIRRRDATFEIATLAPWGLKRRIIAANRISLGQRYAPLARARQHVDAPWQSLRIQGYRVPFIIDLQAGHYDEALARRALRDAVQDQASS